MTTDLDLARVLNPSRPRLDDARAVADDLATRDAAALWEALAARAVIPLDWVAHPARAFEDPRWRVSTEPQPDGTVALPIRGAPGAPSEDDAGLLALARAMAQRAGDAGLHAAALERLAPPTVPACVAFASDPEGVATAEALAREVMARLAPWATPQPPLVLWRVCGRWHVTGERAWGPLRVASTPRMILPRLGAAMRRRSGEDTPTWSARGDAVSAAAWRDAASSGRVVPATLLDGPLPAAVAGRRFADLPDPFAPLVALWNTGYALEAITPRAVVLVCVELPEW